MNLNKFLLICVLTIFSIEVTAGQEIAFWGAKKEDRCAKKKEQEEKKQEEEQPQGFDDEYSEENNSTQKNESVVNKD